MDTYVESSELVATTLLLTPANKAWLDALPKAERTVALNRALAMVAPGDPSTPRVSGFIEKLRAIQPVKSELSAVDMVRMLREGRDHDLADRHEL